MKSNRLISQTFAITMALLMFSTSVGFSIDMHFCQGQLKTFSLLGKAKSCHEVGEGMKNCPHHKKQMQGKELAGNTIAKKGCCSNQTLHFQSDQDQYPAEIAMEGSTQLQHFVWAFIATFLHPALTETAPYSFAHYKSPLIPRDIYVLLESYRL